MNDRGHIASRDGFEHARQTGAPVCHVDGDERIPLILRHRDVRAAAKEWETFSSDAPFRVPIPAEAGMRSVRQLPIELDPPKHTQYRKLLEPWFLRPTKPEYVSRIDTLVETALNDLYGRGTVEIMSKLALPLQSRALAILLSMPEAEAERWIAWGNSMYRDGDGAAKGSELDAYVRAQLKRAREDAGAVDFFAFIANLEIEGRPLTDDELAGIANLTFAGGRDTVINMIGEIVAHFAVHAEVPALLRANPRLINSATEEFVRLVSPLGYIARQCTHPTEVNGQEVEAGSRVALCWAAANHDPEVFDTPSEIKLDRQPNPHMGFGSGRHACLGAAHARTLLRSLIRNLASGQFDLTLVDSHPAIEAIAGTEWRLGFKKLCVRFESSTAGATG